MLPKIQFVHALFKLPLNCILVSFDSAHLIAIWHVVTNLLIGELKRMITCFFTGVCRCGGLWSIFQRRFRRIPAARLESTRTSTVTMRGNSTWPAQLNCLKSVVLLSLYFSYSWFLFGNSVYGFFFFFSIVFPFPFVVYEKKTKT